jgi:hypothetical protein
MRRSRNEPEKYHQAGQDRAGEATGFAGFVEEGAGSGTRGLHACVRADIEHGLSHFPEGEGMTKIFQYKMRYQVYADGYRSQTDDLEVAKIRADFYGITGRKNVVVTENNEIGHFVVYRTQERKK